MRDGGTPLCTGCGRPAEPGEYYCRHCGAATSNRTPYVPYVNIPFNYGPLGSVWDGLAQSGLRGWRRVTLYVLFGLLFAPFFIIGSPFILAEWIRNRKKHPRPR